MSRPKSWTVVGAPSDACRSRLSIAVPVHQAAVLTGEGRNVLTILPPSCSGPSKWPTLLGHPGGARVTLRWRYNAVQSLVSARHER
jgi:hypothetical protein